MKSQALLGSQLVGILFSDNTSIQIEKNILFWRTSNKRICQDKIVITDDNIKNFVIQNTLTKS